MPPSQPSAPTASSLQAQPSPCPPRSACYRHQLAQTPTPSFLLLGNFLPRPPNPQFPQPFLQTLPVQPNRRRRPRNVPAMHPKLPQQIPNLNLPLRLPKSFSFSPRSSPSSPPLGTTLTPCKTSSGKSLAPISSPRESTMLRSIAFFNSRTFPGQS